MDCSFFNTPTMPESESKCLISSQKYSNHCDSSKTPKIRKKTIFNSKMFLDKKTSFSPKNQTNLFLKNQTTPSPKFPKRNLTLSPFRINSPFRFERQKTQKKFQKTQKSENLEKIQKNRSADRFIPNRSFFKQNYVHALFEQKNFKVVKRKASKSPQKNQLNSKRNFSANFKISRCSTSPLPYCKTRNFDKIDIKFVKNDIENDLKNNVKNADKNELINDLNDSKIKIDVKNDSEISLENSFNNSLNDSIKISPKKDSNNSKNTSNKSSLKTKYENDTKNNSITELLKSSLKNKPKTSLNTSLKSSLKNDFNLTTKTVIKHVTFDSTVMENNSRSASESEMETIILNESKTDENESKIECNFGESGVIRSILNEGSFELQTSEKVWRSNSPCGANSKCVNKRLQNEMLERTFFGRKKDDNFLEKGRILNFGHKSKTTAEIHPKKLEKKSIKTLIKLDRKRGDQIPKNAERVLDAPEIAKSSSFNIMGWINAINFGEILAVALGSEVYFWFVESNQIKELDAILDKKLVKNDQNIKNSTENGQNNQNSEENSQNNQNLEENDQNNQYSTENGQNNQNSTENGQNNQNLEENDEIAITSIFWFSKTYLAVAKKNSTIEIYDFTKYFISTDKKVRSVFRAHLFDDFENFSNNFSNSKKLAKSQNLAKSSQNLAISNNLEKSPFLKSPIKNKQNRQNDQNLLNQNSDKKQYQKWIVSMEWNDTNKNLFCGIQNGGIAVFRFGRQKLNLVSILDTNAAEPCRLQWNPKRTCLAAGCRSRGVAIFPDSHLKKYFNWEKSAIKNSLKKAFFDIRHENSSSKRSEFSLKKAERLIAPSFWLNQSATVKGLAWCPWDTNLLVVGTARGQIIAYDTARRKPLARSEMAGAVTGMAFLPQHREIVTAHSAAAKKLRSEKPAKNFPKMAPFLAIWSFPELTVRAVLSGHTKAVIGISLNLSHTVLASCSLDESIRIWRVGNDRKSINYKNLMDKCFR